MCTNPARAERGFTLFEVLLLIVVLAVGLAGILVAINTNVAASADPMVRKQAMAAAESMMEEILLMPFGNPTGGWSGATTQANRVNFDDVSDYNGLNTTGIYTIDNTAVSGLSGYNLSVSVTSAALSTVPATDSKLVQVTVTGPNFSYVLEGYKLNY
jgi:MSHA pilin protein MshD